MTFAFDRALRVSVKWLMMSLLEKVLIKSIAMSSNVGSEKWKN